MLFYLPNYRSKVRTHAEDPKADHFNSVFLSLCLCLQANSETVAEFPAANARYLCSPHHLISLNYAMFCEMQDYVSKLHITLLTMKLKLIDTYFTILFALS